MGMVACFRRIPENDLEKLISAPDTIEDYLFPEDDDDDLNSEIETDIDKSWHVMHFLLTGSVDPVDSPLGKAILGGKEFGEDFGYGPPRYLRKEEVQEINDALTGVDIKEAYKNVNITKEQEEKIYLGFSDEEEEVDYVSHYFIELKKFYKEASSNGDAALLYLS